MSGPNDFISAGVAEVGSSSDVLVAFEHLPVGQGYLLEVTASADDGATVCEGRTTFDVPDTEATLELVVHLTCAVPSGAVSVEAILNMCPTIDALDAVPTALLLGGISTLAVTAHDADAQPLPLFYAWNVNAARLPRPSSPTLRFTCSSRGEVTLTAVVSDGDPEPSCADTLSAKVSCE